MKNSVSLTAALLSCAYAGVGAAQEPRDPAAAATPRESTDAAPSSPVPAASPAASPASLPEVAPATVPTAPAAAPAAPAAAPTAIAEAVSLKGTVKARGSGAPVKGALVFLADNRDVSTETDARGAFVLAVPKGQAKVVARAAGFEDFEIQVVDGVAPENGELLLEPAAELERGGVIRARRKTEVSQQSLQREEVTRIPGTGGDAVRALQTLPSVLATNPGSADISVRGSAPGDNRYFVDRLEVPFVFHLGGLGTVVPTRALEGVDLFPGGFSSIYSDAIGGVVQLRSENKIPERTSGQVEVSTLQSSVYLEGNMFGTPPDEAAPAAEPAAAQVAAPAAGIVPADGTAVAPSAPVARTARADDRIGYRAGFRRTYLEVWAPLIKKNVPAERLSFTTLPQATDYQFILNGNHSSGTWQAYLLGAADRLSLAAQTRASDADDGKSEFSLFNYFQTSGVRYNTNLGNGWGLTLAPQQRYLLIDQQFFDNVVKVTSNLAAFEVSLDKRFSAEWSATVGVRPTFERVVTDVDAIQFPAGGADLFFDPDTAPRSKQKLTRDQTYGNAFFDLTWKPVRPLTLNPGVSLQRGRQPSQFEVDPRFNTRYALGETHALKAAWGYYSQMPQAVFDSEDYGNPDLGLERSIHYVGGWETKLGSEWETDLQVYYKDMFDLVGNATKQPGKKYENNVVGRSKGLEAFVKKVRTGRWSGWLSYGWSRSERRDPRSREWRLFDYDKTHAVNLVGAYKITGQWEVGAKAQYLTGAPTSKVPGGTYNQATGRYVSTAVVRDGTLESNDGERLPAFFQLDVRTDYDILFDTWTLDVYFELLNATNRANVVGKRYNPDYSKEEYVTGAPVIPNLGVIAKF